MVSPQKLKWGHNSCEGKKQRKRNSDRKQCQTQRNIGTAFKLCRAERGKRLGGCYTILPWCYYHWMSYIAYMYICSSFKWLNIFILLTGTKPVTSLQQSCQWEGLWFKRWMINFSTLGCMKFFFLAVLLLTTQCGYSVCNSPGTKGCERFKICFRAQAIPEPLFYVCW